MKKKYRVKLTVQENLILEKNIQSGVYKNTRLKRAQILLGANESEGGKRMDDAEIVRAYSTSLRTVERTRERFVEEGFESALNGKPRPINKKRLFGGREISHLIALRCSEVPSGHNGWTLNLLADKMVELGYVESISYESVRQILKKHQLNRGGSNLG